MKRIQITLTDQEIEILKKQGKKYGYPLTRFVKAIVTEEVRKCLPSQEKQIYDEETEDYEHNKRWNEKVRRFRGSS